MFHIIVNKNEIDEVRGKASNMDELLKLLSNNEIKCIFENDAYESIESAFKRIKKLPGKDTYMESIGNITINYISNGYEITTLLFYF